MKIRESGLVVVLLTSLFTVASADSAPDDPVQERLQREVEKFNDECSAAKARLQSSMEAELKRAEGNSRLNVARRLELVATLKEQQAAFLNSGKPPTLRVFRSDVARYVRTITEAHRDCISAHEKAAEDYGRLGDLMQAKRVLSELAKVRSMQLFGNHLFYPGQLYQGTRAHGPIRGEFFALEIIECDNSRFIAKASGPNDRDYPVIGTVIDGKVTAKMRGTMDKVNHNLSGTLENNEVKLSFSGSTATGGRIKGGIHLKLVAPANP